MLAVALVVLAAATVMLAVAAVISAEAAVLPLAVAVGVMGSCKVTSVLEHPVVVAIEAAIASSSVGVYAEMGPPILSCTVSVLTATGLVAITVA
jgi:hypothetical protein